MTLFWTASVLLTLVLVLVIILPLTRGRAESSHSRNQLNTELYHQRLHELEQDQEQGLLEEGEAATQELQKSLLDDVSSENTQQQYKRSHIAWLPAVLIAIAIAYGGYWQWGAHDKVVHWQDSSSRLSELTRKVLIDPSDDITEQDMADLILALRTKLAEDGDDARGWLLLGRLNIEMRDGESARDALEKALKMSDNPTGVLVPYAEALAMTGETLRAESLIKEVLKEDPNNLEAWSVFAFMAIQENNFAGAISRWEQILQRMSPESPRYAMIERSIAFAQQQLAEGGQEAVTGPRYQVEVNTVTSVPYHPGAVLFISAVDAKQGGAPLAAQRIERPSFPLTITLTNADAMTPNNKMSDSEDIIIKARLAPSGNASDTSDAWEGTSGLLSTKEDKRISIVIDTPL